MSDLVERLRAYSGDDHERGCQGRYYDCSCGYDDKRDPLMNEAADRIEQLEAALREWGSAMNRLSMRVGLTAQDIADVLNPIMDKTRAALCDVHSIGHEGVLCPRERT